MNTFQGATLVIPAYNRAGLIGATIESALAQTLNFYEIIVVDDGSTDNTSNVVKNYKHTGRVRLIETINNGVQAARNTGVAAARTELVALCDSDDLLNPDYLEILGPWIAINSHIDCIYTNFNTFSALGEDTDKLAMCPFNFLDGSSSDGFMATDIPELYRRSVQFQPLFSSGVLFRKDFYCRIGGYNTAFRGVGAEDWEFTLRAINFGNIAICKKPLAKIRKHETNDSRDSTRMNLGEAQILEYGLKNHSTAKIWETEIIKSIEQRKIRGLDGAYSERNFDLVQKIGKDLYWKLPLRSKIKYLISLTPRAAQTILWKILQNRK